ncbi:MAG TPA: hypothetical protein VFM18_11790 [Methanosarcina sp.]|nr:hypothetical protein [Methanosarcina sp.]
MLGLLLGGLLRCVPEFVGLYNKKADNTHELNMLNAQIELEKTKQAGQAQQNAATEAIEELKATTQALQQQAQQIQVPITGVKWLDALDAFIATMANTLNTLVRPLTTYYFLILFGLYKAALLSAALAQTGSVWASILKVYSDDDTQMLSGIMSFWFVGRVFDKKNGSGT